MLPAFALQAPELLHLPSKVASLKVGPPWLLLLPGHDLSLAAGHLQLPRFHPTTFEPPPCP